MSDSNFIGDLILVVIPTVLGVITSLTITRKWQTRKQISDIRHNLMQICDESLSELYIKLSKTHFNLMLHYELISDKTEVINNKINYSNYVTNTEFYPPKNHFPEKYENFLDEFFTLYPSVWKLQSNLLLYIKNLEYGDKKLMSVMNTVDECHVEMLKLFASENIEELKKHSTLFNESSEKLKNKINDFRAFLAIFDLKF